MPACPCNGKDRNDEQRHKRDARKKDSIMQKVRPKTNVQRLRIGKIGKSQTEQPQAHEPEQEGLLFSFKGKVIHCSLVIVLINR
jgi:hypothetical protein